MNKLLSTLLFITGVSLFGGCAKKSTPAPTKSLGGVQQNGTPSFSCRMNGDLWEPKIDRVSCYISPDGWMELRVYSWPKEINFTATAYRDSLGNYSRGGGAYLDIYGQEFHNYRNGQVLFIITDPGHVRGTFSYSDDETTASQTYEMTEGKFENIPIK